MPMSPREVVRKTVRFEKADRIPYALTEQYGSDFANVGMNPSPDARPKTGVDEWGCVWHNIGISNLGEVKEPALKDWADWERLNIPDIRTPKRWEGLAGARDRAGDKFLMGGGISLYERVTRSLHPGAGGHLGGHTHRPGRTRTVDRHLGGHEPLRH